MDRKNAADGSADAEPNLTLYFRLTYVFDIVFEKERKTYMPKLIKNAKENIIREAKILLLAEGVSGLNMRTVATKVGVAAGTLYNYFPSKEHLIASIMLEDWITALAELKPLLEEAKSATDGCEIIFNMIQGFSDQHRATWQSHHNQAEYFALRKKYHKTLIDQLCEYIRPLGERFGFLFDETVAPFIAEVLLSGGTYPQSKFCFLSPCLKKIVENG